MDVGIGLIGGFRHSAVTLEDFDGRFDLPTPRIWPFRTVTVRRRIADECESRLAVKVLRRRTTGQVIRHSSQTKLRLPQRSHSAMDKSVQAMEKADYYANKAAGVGHGGILSDDPEAISKLRAELVGLQSEGNTAPVPPLSNGKTLRGRRLEKPRAISAASRVSAD
jgi:Domain of unknown function (DUF3560)